MSRDDPYREYENRIESLTSDDDKTELQIELEAVRSGPNDRRADLISDISNKLARDERREEDISLSKAGIGFIVFLVVVVLIIIIVVVLLFANGITSTTALSNAYTAAKNSVTGSATAVKSSFEAYPPFMMWHQKAVSRNSVCTRNPNLNGWTACP